MAAPVPARHHSLCHFDERAAGPETSRGADGQKRRFAEQRLVRDLRLFGQRSSVNGSKAKLDSNEGSATADTRTMAPEIVGQGKNAA